MWATPSPGSEARVDEDRFKRRAPAQPGAVAVLRRAGQLVVRVTDAGHGLIPRPDSPGLGFGLGMMARVADELGVATRKRGPGTSVVLRFSLGEAAASCAR